MGHLVVSRAVDLAIAKAREAGVAWVSTRYSNHAVRRRCTRASRLNTT